MARQKANKLRHAASLGPARQLACASPAHQHHCRRVGHCRALLLQALVQLPIAAVQAGVVHLWHPVSQPIQQPPALLRLLLLAAAERAIVCQPQPAAQHRGRLKHVPPPSACRGLRACPG